MVLAEWVSVVGFIAAFLGFVLDMGFFFNNIEVFMK